MRGEVYRSAAAGSIVTKLPVDTEGPKLADLCRRPQLSRSHGICCAAQYEINCEIRISMFPGLIRAIGRETSGSFGQRKINVHRIVGKQNTFIGTLDHPGINETVYISVHSLYITVNSACYFAD